jgi:hypothetical protein
MVFGGDEWQAGNVRCDSEFGIKVPEIFHMGYSKLKMLKYWTGTL